MLGTISTPISRTRRVYSGTRRTLDSMSRLPWGYAATTRQPGTWPSSPGSLRIRVKWTEWGRVEADDPGPQRAGPHSGICRRRKDEEENQQWGTDSNRVDFRV